MSSELERLESAARDFELEADLDYIDPKRLSAVIDQLKGTLCRVVDRARRRGDHQLARLSPAGWVARTCGMSRRAAGDHLCVGKHLDSLPQVSEALAKGAIGYQAASAICHLREQLGEMVDAEREEEMVGYARRFSVEDLRVCCRHARAVADPEGFEKDGEEDFERRWLQVSPLLDGMHSVDGILDPVTGEAFRAALESLAEWRGPEDARNHGQRMADALGELLHHHLDEGRLPRKNGVRPHISVTTTVEGLKGELGAAAAELQSGMPISSKTVQRLACDGSLHRILKADSVVVDVGRTTRAVSPAQWRGLKARYRGCAFPGCDRPISWTNPHHVEFWSHGGPNDLPNLLPPCLFHPRLVHEGGWQVIRAGEAYEFIHSERLRGIFARAPDVSRVA